MRYFESTAAAILGRQSHASCEHAARALSEMIDGQTSPIDLRIDRTAVEVVFGNMHRFGLMELGVTLAHELCVDESLLQAA